VRAWKARGFIFAPALAYRLGAASFPFANRKNFPQKPSGVSYALDTAPIRSKFTKTPFSPASAFDLRTTCSPPAAPRSPPQYSSKNSAEK